MGGRVRFEAGLVYKMSLRQSGLLILRSPVLGKKTKNKKRERKVQIKVRFLILGHIKELAPVLLKGYNKIPGTGRPVTR